jgi:hypothetical protein
MRHSLWLAGALAALVATGARAEPYYPFNAVDFSVPADELDAAAVGEAAVHSGFLPLSESDPRIVGGRKARDAVYEIWEPASHKVATITMTSVKKTGSFVVMFVAKDPGKHNDPLSGEACKRWLKFSSGMRLEFMHAVNKYKFRFPQCTP